jgi:flagellar biosynthesis GTPase FlhF
VIIKKFQANTETEAIMLAKEELGKDAIVITSRPYTEGIYKLFRKRWLKLRLHWMKILHIKAKEQDCSCQYTGA